MQNLKKELFVGCMMIAFTMISCKNEDVSTPLEDPILAIDTSSLINYKGLYVNHRFETPLEVLETAKNIEDIKVLYASFKTANRTIKRTETTTLSTSNVVLPSAEIVYEAAIILAPQFPYPPLEEEDEWLLNEENLLNWDMIRHDFPTLNQQQLIENIEIIETYYSDNLDYLVLQEIAANEALSLTTSQKSIICETESCFYINTMVEAVSKGFGFVRSSISYLLAGAQADNSSGDFFRDLDPGNTRRDAYRHAIWNALLAQYYWTVIPSKSRRINFAKMVADCRETLSAGANDAKEMDYHNNAIGRAIWSDHTGYIYVLGIIVGVNLAPATLLKANLRDAVNQNSCYIVKDHPITIYQYSEEETTAKIIATDAETLVYFIETIAPRRYVTTWYYDYSDCKGGANPDQIQSMGGANAGNLVDTPVPDCAKKVYTTEVIEACFVSKDPNYEPYPYNN